MNYSMYDVVSDQIAFDEAFESKIAESRDTFFNREKRDTLKHEIVEGGQISSWPMRSIK